MNVVAPGTAPAPVASPAPREAVGAGAAAQAIAPAPGPAPDPIVPLGAEDLVSAPAGADEPLGDTTSL